MSDKALQFLKSLNPPLQLIDHAQTVLKTAEHILTCLNLPDIKSDDVYTGALLHDVGKIRHPEELHQPGNQHEANGQKLLLEHGFPQHIAAMCITHSKWEQAASIEALVVALADKLWKNKRIPALEDRIIHMVAEAKAQDFWTLYSSLMDEFDDIAEGGQL